jgi:hypothetical protein
MFLRILGVFVVTTGLMFGLISPAHAYHQPYPPPGHNPSAPELDPTSLGSGIAILAGGFLLLNERRRARK